jgi:hypothetical protein
VGKWKRELTQQQLHQLQHQHQLQTSHQHQHSKHQLEGARNKVGGHVLIPVAVYTTASVV